MALAFPSVGDRGHCLLQEEQRNFQPRSKKPAAFAD
jgi:hypothetical protein